MIYVKFPSVKYGLTEKDLPSDMFSESPAKSSSLRGMLDVPKMSQPLCETVILNILLGAFA